MAQDFVPKRIVMAGQLIDIARRLIQARTDLEILKADLAETGTAFEDDDFSGQVGKEHLSAYLVNTFLGDWTTEFGEFFDAHIQDNSGAATHAAILHGVKGGD